MSYSPYLFIMASIMLSIALSSRRLLQTAIPTPSPIDALDVFRGDPVDSDYDEMCFKANDDSSVDRSYYGLNGAYEIEGCEQRDSVKLCLYRHIYDEDSGRYPEQYKFSELITTTTDEYTEYYLRNRMDNIILQCSNDPDFPKFDINEYGYTGCEINAMDETHKCCGTHIMAEGQSTGSIQAQLVGGSCSSLCDDDVSGQCMNNGGDRFPNQSSIRRCCSYGSKGSTTFTNTDSCQPGSCFGPIPPGQVFQFPIELEPYKDPVCCPDFNVDTCQTLACRL